MKKYCIASVTALYLAFAGYGCSTYEWKSEDMDSRRKPFVETELMPGSPLCGFRLSRCKFELHYFEGQKPEVADRTKYILYIPGGPGDIVDRKNPTLHGMVLGQSVFFDVRGTGYSVIPESNAYDQFLRAKHVVEDIETLRQEMAKKIRNECADGETPMENSCKEGKRPWDAIYAHSWGTIVAQMYAAKYGKKHVTRLILSAPVSRAQANTEEARRTMIVKNLMDIYQKHSTLGCPWPEGLTGKNKKKGRSTIVNAAGQGSDPAIETFCFLTKDELHHIKNELTSLLNDIEGGYGSIAFVSRFYNKLIKDDAEFSQKYKYPAEFFTALRQLESLGGGEQVGYRFPQEFREKKIDAAFFLGYYLMFKIKPDLTDANGHKVRFVCTTKNPFLRSIANWPDSEKIKDRICDRIDDAEWALQNETPNDGSPRASAVFGVYDGIARWIFRVLEDQGRTKNGCFSGKDLRDVASGNLLPDKKVIQEVAKTIGISSDNEEICPWDAAKYYHEVPTLILTGRADPVTAGGQAMYFYENGLARGKRVLIDFPGAGHQMSPQIKVPFNKDEPEKEPSENEIAVATLDRLGSVVKLFLTSGISEFVASATLKGYLDELGAQCKADPLPTSPGSPEPEPPCNSRVYDDGRQ